MSGVRREVNIIDHRSETTQFYIVGPRWFLQRLGRPRVHVTTYVRNTIVLFHHLPQRLQTRRRSCENTSRPYLLLSITKTRT